MQLLQMHMFWLLLLFPIASIQNFKHFLVTFLSVLSVSNASVWLCKSDLFDANLTLRIWNSNLISCTNILCLHQSNCYTWYLSQYKGQVEEIV